MGVVVKARKSYQINKEKISLVEPNRQEKEKKIMETEKNKKEVK